MSLGKKPVISIIFILIFVLGCTSIGGWVQRDEAFYQRAMPAHQAPPLPVEIALDIERITEDGVMIESHEPLAAYGVQAINAQLLGRKGAMVPQPEEMQRKVAQSEEDAIIPEDESVIEETSGHLGQSYKAQAHGPLGFSRGHITARQILAEYGEETDVAQSFHRTNSRREASVGGKAISYIVNLGDTLMKIAFEKHGDYLRWKEIYNVNKHKMENPRKMHVGTKLTINNVKDVHIQKTGKAYVIRKNDTLKSISQKLYGTPDRWQEISNNNPQLIRNPRKIYAGFTLYYPSEKAVDSAIKRELTTEAESQ